MNAKTTKPAQKNSIFSTPIRVSNETFITLFMIGVLVVLFLIFSLFVPNFFTPKNIINILTNNWYLVIIGIGVTFLLITGNFDMSVGGVIAMTGVLSVYFVQGVNVSRNVLANGLRPPLRRRHRRWRCCVRWLSAGSTHSSSRSSRSPASSSRSAR